MPDPHSAVVICTRNRPDDLRRTVERIAAHPPTSGVVCVVDASETDEVEANARALDASSLCTAHWRYDGAPSLARQRNAGVDRLPASVEVVHFLDDDVTVQPGYFDALEGALRDVPALGGVGGQIVEPHRGAPTDWTATARRLFLHDHPTPGRVLPSGMTSSAQRRSVPDGTSLVATDWLVGCSMTIRRSLLEVYRFDPSLTGYSMLEDLDLSYRIGRDTALAVVPEARLVHHRSPANRLSMERDAYERLIHLRWFVEKNGSHSFRGVAYWWSVVGLLLAPFVVAHPNAWGVFWARIRGAATVLRRDHPLLRDSSALRYREGTS